MRYEDYRLRDAAGEARVLASIPAKAFEHERHYLNPLPSHLPAPYQVHQRETDQYGYVVLSANYYWVPGRKRERVKVLEYADQMKIYPRRHSASRAVSFRVKCLLTPGPEMCVCPSD